MPSTIVTLDCGDILCGRCFYVDFTGYSVVCGIYGTELEKLNDEGKAYERCTKCVRGQKIFDKLRTSHESNY